MSYRSHDVDRFGDCVEHTVNGRADVEAICCSGLRGWRGMNQNGLSEAGELKSLSESNVASISLAAEAACTTLSNGNRIIATGTYTRLDGTERAAADLDFATGRFWREFPDTIALADAARSLVDIRGSGAVRDLREAANDWVWERAA